MKVERLDYGLNHDLTARRGTQNPEFKAMSAIEREISSSLHQAKAIEKMKNLEWLKGEMGGILLTALGTGAVAPIFIGFNPFVKPKKDATPEEKKEVTHTKLYTAMRQPISAALAILFQASVQKYIDKGWDSIVNNPEKAKFFRVNLDQSELNTDTYIKSLAQKQMKAENINQPSAFAALFNKDKRTERAAYKAQLTRTTEDITAKQLDTLAKYFEENGKIKVGERFLDNKTLAKLVNEQINDYIKDAQELKKTPEQISRYVDRAKILIDNETYIKELFSTHEATEITKEFIQKETNPQIKVLLEEILALPEDLRANRMSRTLQRIESIKAMCDSKGGFTPENYRKALIERNDILEDRIVRLLDAKIKKPAEANEQTIKEAIENITQHLSFKSEDGIAKSVLKDTDTFSSNITKLKSKIYKDVTKTYKNLIKNNYKSWNQVSKVFVGVFITLPITCTALNWIYPRFMELFFPKLAGVKKGKAVNENAGGDK